MGASPVPPCDDDVFYTFSTDHGATWSAARQITPAGSAQWQPWSVVSPDGSKLYAAYNDRSFGNCEFTGCNDITLATIRNPTSATPSIRHRRVTTSSMPNFTAANNPVQAGFLGDYMWIALERLGETQHRLGRHTRTKWHRRRGRVFRARGEERGLAPRASRNFAAVERTFRLSLSLSSLPTPCRFGSRGPLIHPLTRGGR